MLSSIRWLAQTTKLHTRNAISCTCLHSIRTRHRTKINGSHRYGTGICTLFAMALKKRVLCFYVIYDCHCPFWRIHVCFWLSSVGSGVAANSISSRSFINCSYLFENNRFAHFSLSHFFFLHEKWRNSPSKSLKKSTSPESMHSAQNSNRTKYEHFVIGRNAQWNCGCGVGLLALCDFVLFHWLSTEPTHNSFSY